MISDWRELHEGTYFTLSGEPPKQSPINPNVLVPVVFCITDIIGNTVNYRATHDKGDKRTASIGWVIDNAWDFL